MRFINRLTVKRNLRVAGLMSGTSADGVDVAIVDVAMRQSTASGGPSFSVKVLAFDTYPYTPSLRRQIFELFAPPQSTVDRICHMNAALGEVFAEAVIKLARRARIPLASIDLVGSHGQTIHHIPQGRRFGRLLVASTLQIGEPSVIAERTGITTVADFRPRDIAAGGQGAPLVPYADLMLLGHPTKARASQNIGGIANVTYLPAGATAAKVIAFDTGPGNMVIDRLVSLHTKGKQAFDKAGKLASAGRVNAKLLAELMKHPYLRRKPPKTTGRELFGAAFTDRLVARARAMGIGTLDLIATATAFTAASIADAYRRFLPKMPDEVILCGGGARNETLTRMLADELASAGKPAPASQHAPAREPTSPRVLTMDELGINADAKEAVSFALLAVATVLGLPANVPSATGARRAVVLGKIVPGS